jgi:acetyl-CoA carboxylase biotin carboxyl carrier protein
MANTGYEFTQKNIKELAQLVAEKELSEICIEVGDTKVTIKGRKCPPPPHDHGRPPMPPMDRPPMPPMGAPMGVPMGNPVGGQANAQAETVAEAAVVPEAAPTVSGKEVKAPIVGTFYAAPSPDSDPFVKVGDKVKKGDVIFIIESMKVMSEVQSEVDGVIKEICVNSGDAVEFDQTVMIVG